MPDSTFGYQAVSTPEALDQVTSLIAFEIGQGPLRAVIWDNPRKVWMYAPAPAARFLYDDRYFDRTKELGRRDAEQVAQQVLGVELPSEATLLSMCDEGERMGWDYGPPRGGGG
jgi:hypothetical protein